MALLQPWGITAAPLFSVSLQGVSAGCVLLCLCPGEQRLKWARCGWGEMPQSGSRCLFSERVWLGRTCSKWLSVLDLLLKQFLGCVFFFFYAKADNVEAPDLASVLLALWPHLLEGSLCVCHHRFTQEPSRNCPWHGLRTTSMQSGSSAAVVVWKHTTFPWHRLFAILGHCRGANLIFYLLKLLVLEDTEFVAHPPPSPSYQTLQHLVPGSLECSYPLLLSLNHTMELH